MQPKDFKKQQYEERLLNEVNNLLKTQMADKRLRMISATRVELNQDYSMAKVYWDTYDSSKRGESKTAVNGMVGRMRTLLAKGLKTKYIPKISFQYDNQYDSEQHITQLLNS